MYSRLHVVVGHYTGQLQGGSTRGARRTNGKGERTTAANAEPTTASNEEEDACPCPPLAEQLPSDSFIEPEPSFYEVIRKCRERIDAGASTWVEGDPSPARIAYEAILHSGFCDWSGVAFEWADDCQEPGEVLSAFQTALEEHVGDFELTGDADFEQSGD